MAQHTKTESTRLSTQSKVSVEEIAPLPITDSTLNAVYTVNRHAKLIDDEAIRAFDSGSDILGEVRKEQKNALYGIKHTVAVRLARAAPEAVDISTHQPDTGKEMYRFCFPRWSFHVPKTKTSGRVAQAITEGNIDAQSEQPQVSPKSITSGLELSLADALGILSQHDIAVNEYLERQVVSDDNTGRQIATQLNITANCNLPQQSN